MMDEPEAGLPHDADALVEEDLEEDLRKVVLTLVACACVFVLADHVLGRLMGMARSYSDRHPVISELVILGRRR